MFISQASFNPGKLKFKKGFQKVPGADPDRLLRLLKDGNHQIEALQFTKNFGQDFDWGLKIGVATQHMRIPLPFPSFNRITYIEHKQVAN